MKLQKHRKIRQLVRTSLSATIFFCFLFFIHSCNVQKRIHRKGWHVEWHGANKSSPSEQSTLSPLSLNNSESTQLPFISCNESKEENLPQKDEVTSLQNDSFRPMKENSKKKDAFHALETKTTEIPYEVVPYRSHQKSKTQKEFFSPVRVPLIGYVLLILGFLLGLIGISLLIANALSSVAGGAALYGLVFIFIGALFILFAFNIAVSSLGTKNTPTPEQRLPKKEKKERQPLQKKDKIMLVVFATLLLIIGISVLAF